MKIMVLTHNIGTRSAWNRITNICFDYGLERICNGTYLGELEGKLKAQFFYELKECNEFERTRSIRVFEFPQNAERKIV